MQLIPIKTRILEPPQDDLLAVLDESLDDVEEGDVLAVSSKVVAIHEGRCVFRAETDKAALVAAEADVVIERTYWSSPLTITNSAFISTAGIDGSNGNDHLILLPEDAFASAQYLHTYVQERFSLTNLGIIVTDSHSHPLRRGASGLAIGFWGIKPTYDHRGKKDLFDRDMKVEVSNIADGLAAAATVVMGEAAEQTPVVVLRDVPKLQFTHQHCKDELFVAPKDDTFRVLYERFLPDKE